MFDELYLEFEKKYRGSQELIKARLNFHIQLIKPLMSHYLKMPVIDLACGRGEWLELINNNAWEGIGVDNNHSMITFCQSQGFKVYEDDIIHFLKSIESETAPVITGFHIAEHISFNSLVELIKEAYRIILPGGLLILETPNPENLSVGTNKFYFDPTHIKPQPYQLVSFLAEYLGFSRTKIIFLQEKQELWTQSITLYNVLADVSPDYALIAQKNGGNALNAMLDPIFNGNYGFSLENLSEKYDRQLVESNENLLTNQEATMKRMEELSISVSTINSESQKTAKFVNSIINDLESQGSDNERINSSIKDLLKDIQNLDGKLNNILEENLALEDQMAKGNKDRKELNSIVNSLQSKIDQINEDLSKLHNNDDELKLQLEKVITEKLNLIDELELAKKRNQELSAELQGVYNSKSFRLTAPLRHLSLFMKKIFRSQASQSIDSTTIQENVIVNGYQDTPAVNVPEYGIETSDQEIKGKVDLTEPWMLQEDELDSIMEKIRREVNVRKSGNIDSQPYTSGQYNETKLFRLIKWIQKLLKGLPFFNIINTLALKFKPLFPKYKERVLNTRDLTKFNGEEFIKQTYLEILGRPADPDGLKFYLHLLKHGDANKIQIIGKIRYSQEGKRMGVKVKGFPWKYIMGIFYD